MQGLLNKYRKGEEGATAIEFAILSIPFVMFLIGIIEISLMIANYSILEASTDSAARMIRTGQVQQGEEEPVDFFRETLCEEAIIMDCSRFQFQVTKLDNFTQAQDNIPEFDDEGNLVDQDFEAGDAGDIILIRVTYMYNFFTPFIGQLFSNYGTNKRLMMSTVVMQNEPYQFE